MHKVDDNGFLHLSGLLKVTEGYGKQGSKLKDIAFEAVDSEGKVDHAIHDEEKHGNPHMLKILTDLPDSGGLRYAFQQGLCTIPSINLAQRGPFSIVAVHSQYSELRVKFEINVLKSAPKDDTVSDASSDVQASENLSDDDIQSLDERLSHDSVSDAAEQVMSSEVLELQDKEEVLELQDKEVQDMLFVIMNIEQSQDEYATLSPLQTRFMEHATNTPPISDENFLLASGNVSALAESNLQEQQFRMSLHKLQTSYLIQIMNTTLIRLNLQKGRSLSSDLVYSRTWRKLKKKKKSF